MISRALDITASPCRPEDTVIARHRLLKVPSHIPRKPAPDTVSRPCKRRHSAVANIRPSRPPP